MGVIGFAEYLTTKYAGSISDEPDTSFGVPINPEKTRILKDKLILSYDKITKDITKLPAFQELNDTLSDSPYLQEFNKLIQWLVNHIEKHNLKNGFNYSVRLIETLNKLREEVRLSDLPKEKSFDLQTAIKSIQDMIWEESKRILNLHDLRGLDIKAPEDVKSLVKTVIPTWDYGPGKNPTKSLPKVNRPSTSLMKRLEIESLRDEIAQRLGPYATDQEIEAMLQKEVANKDKAKRKQVVDKYNQSLKDKDKK